MPLLDASIIYKKQEHSERRRRPPPSQLIPQALSLFIVLDANVLQFFASRNGENVVEKSQDSDRATDQHEKRMVWC